MESLMKHVETARTYMQVGEYDKAYDEYCVVADALNGLSGIENNDMYRNEIVPSLEILRERGELVNQVNLKREGVKKFEDAEYEYKATEGCGSEHTAAWYSLNYLYKSGYGDLRVPLKRLEKELQTYESKLLGLWQERIQQVCV